MLVKIKLLAEEGPLNALLEGLVLVNVEILANSDLPPLYESGVRYQREGRREDWKSADRVLRDGHGDCEDLAAWLAASYRSTGEDARAIVKRTGKRTWHAVVMRGDGSIECPSSKLGM